MNYRKNITDYLKARYALLVIESFEEERIISELQKISRELNHEIYIWNSTQGVTYKGSTIGEKTFDLKSAIDFCEEKAKEDKSKNIFVFCDAHNYLNNNSNPIYRRRLKDFAFNVRNKGYRSNCIIISPSYEINNDLQKEVTIIDFPLPTREEIKFTISSLISSWRRNPNVQIDVDDELLEKYVDASLGLTFLEIENCLAKALVSDHKLDETDLKILYNEKKQIIRKTGILEFIDSDLDLKDVGGLGVLKKWLEIRSHCFNENAKKFGIAPPKGVLLTGIPGCGKSLTAKCVASAWNMPLIRLDMGKIFQGLVGSSESNMRQALKTAEGISPCILWIDEIEKGLSGSANSSSDGGTSTRVFGTLLTWMQEKAFPVFVFATANNINGLPPELLRKGRFDEIFFVDFPSEEERRKILEIHITKLGREISEFDISRLVELSGGKNFEKDVVLSGAEIEAWVADSLIEAFSRKILNGDSEVDLEMIDFETTIKRMVPMAKMRKEEFAKLREWANQNAISASMNQESHLTNENFTGGRRIDI